MTNLDNINKQLQEAANDFPLPESVYVQTIPHISEGAGSLWRHNESGTLFLLAQVGYDPTIGASLFAFISLGGNRIQDPRPWYDLPFDQFERITSEHTVKFVPSS